MALTTSAQRLRLKIQDIPLLADITRYGNGTATTFALDHTNLTSASAFVPNAGGNGWTATGATFNPSGAVAFSGVISANSAYRLTYTYSTFSDEDIDQFLTDGGTVAGAASEALIALMFDASKRARWMASDGSSYDDTNAQSHLRQMYDLLQQEISQEATTGGGMQSWALNQGDY